VAAAAVRPRQREVVLRRSSALDQQAVVWREQEDREGQVETAGRLMHRQLVGDTDLGTVDIDEDGLAALELFSHSPSSLKWFVESYRPAPLFSGISSRSRPGVSPAARLRFLASSKGSVEIAWRAAMNSFIWRSQIRYDMEIQSCKRRRVDPGGPLMRAVSITAQNR
jgi:hypothetical protein